LLEAADTFVDLLISRQFRNFPSADLLISWLSTNSALGISLVVVVSIGFPSEGPISRFPSLGILFGVAVVVFSIVDDEDDDNDDDDDDDDDDDVPSVDTSFGDLVIDLVLIVRLRTPSTLGLRFLGLLLVFTVLPSGTTLLSRSSSRMV